MTHVSPGVPARLRNFTLGALALAMLLGASSCSARSPKGSALPADAKDPRAATLLIKPAELAGILKGTGEKPVLLHVGFKVLYHGGAIPGSIYVGPGQSSEGIAALKAAVKDLPRDRAVVVYCGCCPWDHCPNMRPAFQTLVDMGFKNARALYSPKNLETDWVNQGYPIEQPAN